jgi:hypothetical protein
MLIGGLCKPLPGTDGVAFIYAGFGLAFSESTPNVPIRASHSRHSAF